MNRGIYATATGMLAGQKGLDVIANNLANVSTTGFKRDELVFADAYVREMRLAGGRGALIGSLGSGTKLVAEYTIFEEGPINPTGNPLDIAIDSAKGLLAVQTPQGIRYTRDGSLQLDKDRRLVTRDGYPVLDDRNSPIELPEGQIEILADGRVVSAGQEVGRIGLFEGTFNKAGGNLFSGSASPVDEVSLKVGALEGSNVNAVEAMIEMIGVNRSFEMAQKSLIQQDELTQRLIQSLQDR